MTAAIVPDEVDIHVLFALPENVIAEDPVDMIGTIEVVGLALSSTPLLNSAKFAIHQSGAST